MNTPNTIGQEIKRLRKIRKLTQQQLAGLVEMPTQNISAIENDRQNLSFKMARKFAKVLDADLLIKLHDKQARP